MRKKSIVISTLVVMLLMIFAPVANASNVFYFNSRTGSFQPYTMNWNNSNQERLENNRFTSMFSNIYYFFSQNIDSENQEPPVNNDDNNIDNEKSAEPEKPVPEQEEKPKEEQPIEAEDPQAPEENEKPSKPEQPKEESKPEPKPEQPKEEEQKNDNDSNTVSTQAFQMLEYVNQERAKAGVALIQMDTKLADVAEIKSQDMVDNNYFSHTSPTYGSPFDMMRSFGITYRAAAENIAKNSSVASAHTALMNSQGHRANILNPTYTHIGIGIVNSGSNITVTQMFISK